METRCFWKIVTNGSVPPCFRMEIDPDSVGWQFFIRWRWPRSRLYDVVYIIILLWSDRWLQSISLSLECWWWVCRCSMLLDCRTIVGWFLMEMNSMVSFGPILIVSVCLIEVHCITSDFQATNSDSKHCLLTWHKKKLRFDLLLSIYRQQFFQILLGYIFSTISIKIIEFTNKFLFIKLFLIYYNPFLFFSFLVSLCLFSLPSVSFLFFRNDTVHLFRFFHLPRLWVDDIEDHRSDLGCWTCCSGSIGRSLKHARFPSSIFRFYPLPFLPHFSASIASRTGFVVPCDF